MGSGLGFLSGFLADTNSRIDSARKEERDRQDTIDNNERAVLSHLSTSEDPNISGRAISALAEMGAGGVRPKGGYLNRLVTGGQGSMHPVVEQALTAILHTPSSIDVEAGRAAGAGLAAGGASGGAAGAAPAGAAGGASPVGPTAGSRGGTPAEVGPGGAPPDVAPAAPGTAGGPPPVVQAGAATEPPRAAAAPGGGPASPAAFGSPSGASGAPPKVSAPGMAGVRFGGGAGAGAGAPPPQVGAPPPGTPMPQGPPAAAGAPPPQVGAGAGAPGGGLPVEGVPQGPNFFATTNRTPELQRAALLKAEAGTVQTTKDAQYNADLTLYNKLHPQGSESPEARAQGLALLEYKHLGTLPKFGAKSAPMTVEQAQQANGDVNLDPMNPNSPKLSTLPHGSLVTMERAPNMMVRFTPTTTAAQVNAGLHPSLYTLALRDAGVEPGAIPTSAQAHTVLKNLADRQKDITAAGIHTREDASLDEKAKTTGDAYFMDNEGNVTPIIVNGLADHFVRDAAGKLVPFTRQDGLVLSKGSATVLPNKLDPQAKQTLQGIDIMRTTNQRILSAIEQAGVQNSNDVIGPRFFNWLYEHGIDPGDLKGVPFANTAQMLGYSEATGLRSFIGGRPNQSLIDVYSQHLGENGESFQLIYDKLKGLEPLMDTAEQGITKAQAMKLAPGGGMAPGTGVQPAAPGTSGRGSGAPPAATIKMIDTKGVAHDVLASSEAAAAAKGWKRVGGGGGG